MIFKTQLFALTLLLVPQVAFGDTDHPPNIVIMLADDMGFGEVQALNPSRGKIPTPCLDKIAKQGMVFLDAHSGSSVCTPTRYGLLTGRYAWRTRLQKGVLTGGESLIAPDRMTLATFLRQLGYETAIIGKWHLGMLFDGKKNPKPGIPLETKVTHGPVDRGGFDRFQGFNHSRQMDILISNDVVGERLKPIEALPKLTQLAVEYIHERKDSKRPFFLYLPWNSPHSPVVPSEEWQGKSGLNAHADFVMQTDDSFGQVMKALNEAGIENNTLVICSSDNGTSAPTSQMKQLQEMGHFPSGDLRGSKSDIWDGGHRVPFLVQWPAVVSPGSRSSELVCLTDVFATVAEQLQIELPADTAEDSYSFLPLLKGKKKGNRTDVIHHSSSGKFAIREGDWKLILCAGSGGWTRPRDKVARKADAPKWQLYNLKDDLGEQENLFPVQASKADELRQLLEVQVVSGRSTPGPRLANDVEVSIEK